MRPWLYLQVQEIMQAAMMEKWQTASKVQEDVVWLISLHLSRHNFLGHFTV